MGEAGVETEVKFLFNLFLALAVSGEAGCNTLKSRYAMGDPNYAEKYSKGVEKSDILGTTKQAIDARHVAGLSGWSIGGATLYRPKSDNTFGGLEVGFERYPTSWLWCRVGFASYMSEEEGYLGAIAGLRLQMPTRLAPFVGVGTLLGDSRTVSSAPDGRDNDEDMFVDESGEVADGIDHFLTAVYPETGVQFWLTHHWRLSVDGCYMFTNLGDNHDDWMIGGQLKFSPNDHDWTTNRRSKVYQHFARYHAVIWPCSGFEKQVGHVLLKKNVFLSLGLETTCACQGGITATVSG